MHLGVLQVCESRWMIDFMYVGASMALLTQGFGLQIHDFAKVRKLKCVVGSNQRAQLAYQLHNHKPT